MGPPRRWARWRSRAGTSDAAAHAGFLVAALVLAAAAIVIAVGPAHTWLVSIIQAPTALTPPPPPP